MKGIKLMENTVNTTEDFRQIVMEQQKDAPPAIWSGNLLDYMTLVEENPALASLSPARIYNMIMKYGTEPVEGPLRESVSVCQAGQC